MTSEAATASADALGAFPGGFGAPGAGGHRALGVRLASVPALPALRAVMRAIVTAMLPLAIPLSAQAHQLVVFATVECDAVTVEAKFSNGRVAQQGDVRVLDGKNSLLTTLSLGRDGTVRLPLAEIDHGGGLVIEVDTGGHDNYWIVTPEDIARKCGS